MVIITHTLYCRTQDGEVEIPILIEKPMAGENDWSCRFEIGWPDGTETRLIYGIDALQALVLTLQFIGARIYGSEYHEQGRLRAYDKEHGYGFPLPCSWQHMAIGTDAIVSQISGPD